MFVKEAIDISTTSGYSAVLNAVVMAEVETPSGVIVNLTLLDNGAGKRKKHLFQSTRMFPITKIQLFIHTHIAVILHLRHGVSNHRQLDYFLNNLFRIVTTKYIFQKNHCYRVGWPATRKWNIQDTAALDIMI